MSCLYHHLYRNGQGDGLGGGMARHLSASSRGITFPFSLFLCFLLETGQSLSVFSVARWAFSLFL